MRESLREGPVQPAGDGVEDGPDRLRRLGGEPRRERLRGGHDLRRGHHAIDESDAPGLLRVDGFTGQQQLEGTTSSDEASEGAASRRNRG